jgi:phospholipid/cholesterol/gamma-HCH transport system ATP-binding protein
MLKRGKIAAMAEPAEFQRTTDPEIKEFISVGGTVTLRAATSEV